MVVFAVISAVQNVDPPPEVTATGQAAAISDVAPLWLPNYELFEQILNGDAGFPPRPGSRITGCSR
jgi:hypothetical protein